MADHGASLPVNCVILNPGRRTARSRRRTSVCFARRDGLLDSVQHRPDWHAAASSTSLRYLRIAWTREPEPRESLRWRYLPRPQRLQLCARQPWRDHPPLLTDTRGGLPHSLASLSRDGMAWMYRAIAAAKVSTGGTANRGDSPRRGPIAIGPSHLSFEPHEHFNQCSLYWARPGSARCRGSVPLGRATSRREATCKRIPQTSRSACRA